MYFDILFIRTILSLHQNGNLWMIKENKKANKNTIKKIVFLYKVYRIMHSLPNPDLLNIILKLKVICRWLKLNVEYYWNKEYYWKLNVVSYCRQWHRQKTRPTRSWGSWMWIMSSSSLEASLATLLMVSRPTHNIATFTSKSASISTVHLYKKLNAWA